MAQTYSHVHSAPQWRVVEQRSARVDELETLCERLQGLVAAAQDIARPPGLKPSTSDTSAAAPPPPGVHATPPGDQGAHAIRNGDAGPSSAPAGVQRGPGAKGGRPGDPVVRAPHAPIARGGERAREPREPRETGGLSPLGEDDDGEGGSTERPGVAIPLFSAASLASADSPPAANRAGRAAGRGGSRSPVGERSGSPTSTAGSRAEIVGRERDMLGPPRVEPPAPWKSVVGMFASFDRPGGAPSGGQQGDLTIDLDEFRRGIKHLGVLGLIA
ncbi:hypothetical protein T484DRAFT_1778376 [Baffinella frigidus]|nr:hypothetical protein T484DRAFT_1778376 [Cryptophyta sp. CCMP2293]